MSNSLVHSLEGYLHAMFQDVAYGYGSKSDWERDKNRSLHELAIRGERLLTLDLPALRKHLEKCLEEGLYTPSKLYLSGRVSKAVQVPAFCRDLYLQIFNVQGKLRSEPNPTAVLILRQLFEGWGKLKNNCKEKAIAEEVTNFLDNERDLRSPTLAWTEDTLIEDSNVHSRVSFCDAVDNDSDRREDELFGVEDSNRTISHRDARTLQSVCDIISSSFGDLDSEVDSPEFSERPKHGTGRVSNLKRGHSKYDFSRWPKKLDLVFPYDRYAVSDLGHSAYLNDFSGVLLNHEEPSKLIAVPKTMAGPRLIGSEPNYHQWIQQLVRNQIEGRIKSTSLRHCISFGDQEPNRQLALQGSINGRTATVDLKSASDRLSCWTIERALRGNFTLLRRIHASRTRTMRNAIDKQFDRIILKKCFTQGSACTFPVQTVVYSMVAIASILITEGLAATSSNIERNAHKARVFGDDIIVPTNSLPKLIEILSYLQLKVNLNKTFSKERFRESCGLDAYAGENVTPARVKRFSTSPSHEVAVSMLQSSNNFFARGYWATAAWLQSFLRRFDLPIVSLHDSDGLVSFCGRSDSHLPRRWNSNTHSYDIRRHHLVSKSKKVATQSADDLVEFLFSKTPKAPWLEHLDPCEGGLGVVDKVASVMKRGWVPQHFNQSKDFERVAMATNGRAR